MKLLFFNKRIKYWFFEYHDFIFYPNCFTLPNKTKIKKVKQSQSHNALSMYKHSLLLSDCCLDGD